MQNLTVICPGFDVHSRKKELVGESYRALSPALATGEGWDAPLARPTQLRRHALAYLRHDATGYNFHFRDVFYLGFENLPAYSLI